MAAPASPRREVLRFLGILAAVLSLLYAFSQTALFERTLGRGSLLLNARLGAAALRALGEDASSAGTLIRTPLVTLDVQEGCDALEPMGIFIAAVLAVPVALSLRLAGVLGGALLLVLVNQLRTVSLFYTAVHYPDAFDFMHLEVWQALFIFLGALIWLGWAAWTLRIETAAEA